MQSAGTWNYVSRFMPGGRDYEQLNPSLIPCYNIVLSSILPRVEAAMCETRTTDRRTWRTDCRPLGKETPFVL
ncbi:UNVERIFIED_CONTAM: hypothetical protein Sradi_5672500 [Sesamum radiatum]|uniref:Uncharacterized protein n=1 Tax=Sesamum radiatum TaxID=300843 RepID=A0AAW2L1N4_SESRA